MSGDRRAQQIERLSRAISGTASSEDWFEIERCLRPAQDPHNVRTDREGHEASEFLSKLFGEANELHSFAPYPEMRRRGDRQSD